MRIDGFTIRQGSAITTSQLDGDEGWWSTLRHRRHIENDYNRYQGEDRGAQVL